MPEHVVEDILSRMRVKDVLRFRVLAKAWCDRIDSPEFVKLHLGRSVGSGAGVSVVHRLGTKLHASNLNSVAKSTRCFLHCREPSELDVIGSCNGLLLMALHYDDKRGVLTLFNPGTRRVRYLPSSNFHCSAQRCSVDYGLGYDSTDEDYKIIEIIQIRPQDSLSRSTRANVYSLTRNSWREVQAFTDNFSAHGPWRCEVGGALHILGRLERGEKVQHPAMAITAFHVRSEKFRDVPLPEYGQDYLDMAVAELGGCLCLACHYKPRRNYRVEVWIMKEYGVGGSWIKLLSFMLHLFGDPIPLPVPVAYSATGDKLLFNCRRLRLFWYDLTNTPDSLDLRPRENSTAHSWCEDECVCVDSLVPLNGRGRVDNCNEVLSYRPNEDEAQSYWLPPQKGWIKVNCAGDWDSRGGTVGVVARDMHGKVMFLIAKRLSCTSAVWAEAAALQEAVLAADDFGLPKVILEFDSKDVIAALNSNLLCCGRGGIEAMLMNVMSKSTCFRNLYFSYVKRSANQAARWLSCQAKVDVISLDGEQRVPRHLKLLCSADAPHEGTTGDDKRRSTQENKAETDSLEKI
ncbi:hypothetical protein RJ639_028458 [Escallonia herrerae]|uniref:F-box domain-containing protein n=1 Tax=Escallonia herrerae TaxID=1293975 RepID=A0AA88XDF1_9ASTE|nr:hypothetical protein RJ639_028458 [Escallonia herrerae]